MPAVDQFLNESVPLLTRLTPYLGGVIPVVDYINTYRREVAAFFRQRDRGLTGHVARASGNGVLHYVRVSSPLNPKTLTDYSHRLGEQTAAIRGSGSRNNNSSPCVATSGVRKLFVHE